MAASPTSNISSESTSSLVDPSTYDTLGFCNGFPLRRHRYEQEANEGSCQARADWQRCIGPVEKVGNANRYSGHFNALVLLLCQPSRLRVVSYITEYAFIYDQLVESVQHTDFIEPTDGAGIDVVELWASRSESGTQHVQSKMLLGLMEIDYDCAKVIIDAWKDMVQTTAKLDKQQVFTNLTDYVEYRIIDTGAPFVDSLMRFGMALTLTDGELRKVDHIRHACFAALGLTNDFFSFDEEWASFQDSDETTLTNAVWLFTQWHSMDIAAAKHLVRQEAHRYETAFLREKQEFVKSNPHEIKLHRYLDGLMYQVSGNVAWSRTCPRYHPEKRYDPNDYTDFMDIPIRHAEPALPTSRDHRCLSDDVITSRSPMFNL